MANHPRQPVSTDEMVWRHEEVLRRIEAKLMRDTRSVATLVQNRLATGAITRQRLVIPPGIPVSGHVICPTDWTEFTLQIDQIYHPTRWISHKIPAESVSGIAPDIYEFTIKMGERDYQISLQIHPGDAGSDIIRELESAFQSVHILAKSVLNGPAIHLEIPVDGLTLDDQKGTLLAQLGLIETEATPPQTEAACPWTYRINGDDFTAFTPHISVANDHIHMTATEPIPEIPIRVVPDEIASLSAVQSIASAINSHIEASIGCGYPDYVEPIQSLTYRYTDLLSEIGILGDANGEIGIQVEGYLNTIRHNRNTLTSVLVAETGYLPAVVSTLDSTRNSVSNWDSERAPDPQSDRLISQLA